MPSYGSSGPYTHLRLGFLCTLARTVDHSYLFKILPIIERENTRCCNDDTNVLFLVKYLEGSCVKLFSWSESQDTICETVVDVEKKVYSVGRP